MGNLAYTFKYFRMKKKFFQKQSDDYVIAQRVILAKIYTEYILRYEVSWCLHANFSMMPKYFYSMPKRKTKTYGCGKIKPRTFKNESLMQYMIAVNIFSFNTYVGNFGMFTPGSGCHHKDTISRKTKKFLKSHHFLSIILIILW